jgi:serine/threonine-protein kinase
MIDRLNAALEGRYSIEGELGAGGMATVFLANDIKHERKVALKVLKPELAAVVGAERFLAEIKTTANLQHPHILALFDSGEADSFLFYVMPYVDGETLKERIDREKQLSVTDAVTLTQKIADALDYAHERGVVHRDIKPANILVSDRGEPIVADFGIALAVAQAGAGRITETGLSLGTPHYMSPEQATGDRDVDPRSDVYALGCVLYEMLAGQPPFMASTAQAILVQILTADAPPITTARRTVPRNVAHALARALEKLPADRFTTAREFANALADESFTYEALAQTSVTTAAPALHVGSPTRESWLSDWRTKALVGIAVAVTTLAAWMVSNRPEAPVLVQRFAIDMQGYSTNPRHKVIISPDGRRLAMMAHDDDRTSVLYWREVGEERFQRLETGGRPFYPTFSPDGDWLAYVDNTVPGAGSALMRVSLSGGAPRPIVPSGFDVINTPSWSVDGTIVFGSETGLWSVPGTGGDPELLMEGSVWVVQPRLLPGGAALTYTNRRDQSTYILDLASDSSRLLIPGGIDATYLSTGHLLYADLDGGLWAQPLDVDRLETTGDAVPMFSGLTVGGEGWAKYSVSDGGTLVYGLGSAGAGGPVERLFISDLDGNGETPNLEPRPLDPIAWAPDGETVAFESPGTASGSHLPQIFTYNTVLGDIPRPLTFEGDNQNPQWSPDGTRIVFDRLAEGTDGEDLYVMTLGDDSPPELLISLPGDQEAYDWPTDDIIFFEHGVSGSADIWVYDFRVDSAYAYLATEGDIFQPVLSPDGSLVAYMDLSETPGRIYVRSFPAPRQPELVSRGVDIGGEPRWAPDGNTLYYWTGSDEAATLVAARLGRTPSFGVTSTDTLLTGNYDRSAWDLHPDGNRFIVPVPANAAPRTGAEAVTEAERFVVAVNWFQELLETLGTGR